MSDLAIDVGATAVERARRTNPNLDVTWEQPAHGRPAAALVSASETANTLWEVDWRAVAQEEEAVVAESLAGWQEKYPQVTVRRHMARQLPVEALVDESRKTCLVVVGNRGRGGFAGLLLGSVSQGVMHKAQCPVAIVHTA